MPTPLQPELDRVRALLLDRNSLVRAVAAGRRRSALPSWRRVELRPVALRSGDALQVVRHDERQAFTDNHPWGSAELGAAVDVLLAEPFGNWHVETTTETLQLRVTKKGDAQVHTAPRPPTPPTPALREGVLGRSGPYDGRLHDRLKARLLDPSHPVLREVGIADAHGRVKPSRQSKYRQVEDFLRQLAAVLPDDREGDERTAHSAQGRLHVVDLGCGNAYLTFAAYAYLVDVRGLDVELVGVDVRPDSRERNTGLAERLGWSDRVRFLASPIETVELEHAPDVVLALHACDTATDDAIARAVRWRAPVLLAAPCCHHDLQRRMAAAATPEPYGMVTRHGLLRERLADVLTDAFRASVLRLLGHRVEVVEFVDSAHTPRNALIRAVRTDAPPTVEQVDELRAMTAEWGVTPYLADVLAAELETVLGRG